MGFLKRRKYIKLLTEYLYNNKETVKEVERLIVNSGMTFEHNVPAVNNKKYQLIAATVVAYKKAFEAGFDDYYIKISSQAVINFVYPNNTCPDYTWVGMFIDHMSLTLLAATSHRTPTYGNAVWCALGPLYDMINSENEEAVNELIDKIEKAVNA